MPARLAQHTSSSCSLDRSFTERFRTIWTLVLLLTLVGQARAETWSSSSQARNVAPTSSLRRGSSTSWLTPEVQSSQLLTLEPHNFAQVLQSLATPDGQIILTTLSFTHQEKFNFDQLNYSRNFAYYLHKAGRLGNLLVLSYDEETCLYMLRAGLLCCVDRTAPQPADLKGQYTEHVPHWYQKYWWALTLLEMDYTVLFMDNDAAVLRDPFQHYDPSYDIQGLSDWNYMAQLPTPQEALLEPCNVYKMVPDQTKAGGQLLMFTGWAAVPGANHTNPCQSTGLWFAMPTDASKRFLRHFLVWLLDVRLSQWDQAAWNEVIMAHLFGAGDREPLRHRLLPESQYNNYGTYVMRLKQGLPVQEVALHMGAVHGVDKMRKMQQLHFWKPTSWKAAAGQPIIDRVAQVMREEERTHARRSHRLQDPSLRDWRRRAGLESLYSHGTSQPRVREPLSYLRDLGLVTLGAVFATALRSCCSWLRSWSRYRAASSACGRLPRTRCWGPAVQPGDHRSWQGGDSGSTSPARPPTPYPSSKLLIQKASFSKPDSPPMLRSLAS